MQREYSIIYLVDAGQARGELGALKTQFTTTTQAAHDAGAAIDHSGAMAAAAAPKYSAAAVAVGEIATAAKGTIQPLIDMGMGVAEVGKLTDKAGRAAYDAGGAIAGFGVRAEVAGQRSATAATQVGILSKEAASLTPNLNAAGAALNGLGVGAGQAAPHVAEVHSGVLNLGTALFALQAGAQVGAIIGEHFKQARDHVKKLAEDVIALRDSMRELAVLQGKDTPTDEVLAGAAELSMQTGLGMEGTRKFLQEYLGAAEIGHKKIAGRDKDGNPIHNLEAGSELEKQVMQEGALFGARNKIGEGTAGKMVGLLSEFSHITSREQAAHQMGAIGENLKDGVGSMENLATATIKAASSTVEEHGGAVASLEDISAWVSTASATLRPDKAGTGVQKLISMMRKFSGPEGEVLESIGLKPEMKANESVKVLAKIVRDGDAAGIGGDIALRKAGFKDEEAIKTAVAIGRNIDVLESQLARNKTIKGEEVIAANRTFLEGDDSDTGRARRGKAAEEARNMLMGMQTEKWQTAKKFGGLHRKEEGAYDPGWGKTAEDWASTGGLVDYNDFFNGKEATIHLLREMKKTGVGQEKIFGPGGAPVGPGEVGTMSEAEAMRIKLASYTTDTEMKEFFNKNAPKVRALGGKPEAPVDAIEKKVKMMAQGLVPDAAGGPGKPGGFHKRVDVLPNALTDWERKHIDPNLLGRAKAAGPQPVTVADEWHRGMAPGNSPRSDDQVRLIQERMVRTLDRIEQNTRPDGAGPPQNQPRPPQGARRP